MRDTLHRREQIVEAVQAEGRVRVDELSERFDVSTVTIRGDLNELDRRGLLIRSRGGAVNRTSLTKELSVEDRGQDNPTLKQKIGLRTAELIHRGDSILLDSGSTTEEVARNLPHDKDLHVMTNGLNVASALSKAEGVELMVCGGTLRQKSQSFYGRRAEDGLRDLSFDKFFLGVDGFSLQGITTHFEPEAYLNKVMCRVASEVIAVTDSSKFGRKGLYLISSVPNLTAVVTDSGIPKEYSQLLADAGVTLHIVDI